MAAVDHPPVTARTRRLLALLLVPLLAALAVATIALWPPGDASVPGGGEGKVLDATISALRSVPCADTAPAAEVRCVRAEVRLASGGVVALEERASLGDVGVGTHVLVRRVLGLDGQPAYRLAGYRRGRAIATFAVIGVGLLLLVARRRGLQLLVALALAGVVLLVFTVPGATGGDTVRFALVSGVSGGLVAVLLLVVGRGPSARAATALVGSLVGVAASTALARIAVVGGNLGRVDADPVPATPQLAGLLLAGMVLAAVGAVTHAAVGVVDDTWDLRGTEPAAGWRGIARAGLARGRERVAGITGVVALAYVGIGFGVLAVLTDDGVRIVDALSSEPIATVVLGALVGVLAVLVAVPVTAALAAAIVVREAGNRGPDDPRRFRSRAERDIWDVEEG
jgi:uncharacterized membrane protein